MIGLLIVILKGIILCLLITLANSAIIWQYAGTSENATPIAGMRISEDNSKLFAIRAGGVMIGINYLDSTPTPLTIRLSESDGEFLYLETLGSTELLITSTSKGEILLLDSSSKSLVISKSSEKSSIKYNDARQFNSESHYVLMASDNGDIAVLDYTKVSNDPKVDHMELQNQNSLRKVLTMNSYSNALFLSSSNEVILIEYKSNNKKSIDLVYRFTPSSKVDQMEPVLDTDKYLLSHKAISILRLYDIESSTLIRELVLQAPASLITSLNSSELFIVQTDLSVRFYDVVLGSFKQDIGRGLFSSTPLAKEYSQKAGIMMFNDTENLSSPKVFTFSCPLQNCDTCYLGACLQCSPGFYVDSKSSDCLEINCKEGEIWDQSISKCLAVIGCTVGFYLDPNTNKCISIECSIGERFNKEQQKCIEFNCSLGYILDLATNSCVPIICNSIQRFNSSSNKCENIICEEGTTLNIEQGICMEIECSIGYYLNHKSFECEEISCDSGFEWENTTLTCKEITCPIFTIMNISTNSCEPTINKPIPTIICDITCKECIDETSTGCASCFVGFELDSNSSCKEIAIQPKNESKEETNLTNETITIFEEAAIKSKLKILFKKKNSTMYLITFEEPLDVKLKIGREIQIKPESWKYEIDYFVDLKEINNENKEYSIQFNPLMEDYSQQIEISIIGQTSQNGSRLYSPFITSIIASNLSNALGLSKETVVAVESTGAAIADYFPILGAVFPSLTKMFSLYNALKIYSLIPIRYPIAFMKYIMLFGKLKDEDFLGTILFKKRSNDDKHRLYTRNIEFSFTPLYQRCRLSKMISRFLVNVAFALLVTSIRYTTSKEIGWMKRFLVSLIVSQNIGSLPADLCYIIATIMKGNESISLVLAFLDLSMIVIFFCFLFSIYRRNNGSKYMRGQYQILMDKVFIFQDKNHVTLPYFIVSGVNTTLKIIIIVALQDYPTLFAYTFIIYSLIASASTTILIWKGKKRIPLILNGVGDLLESILIIQISLLHLIKSLQDSEYFIRAMLLMGCASIAISVMLVISLQVSGRKQKNNQKIKEEEKNIVMIEPPKVSNIVKTHSKPNPPTQNPPLNISLLSHSRKWRSMRSNISRGFPSRVGVTSKTGVFSKCSAPVPRNVCFKKREYKLGITSAENQEMLTLRISKSKRIIAPKRRVKGMIAHRKMTKFEFVKE